MDGNKDNANKTDDHVESSQALPSGKKDCISGANLQAAIKELQSLIDENSTPGLPSDGEFFYYWGLANFRRAYHKQEKDWEGFNPQQVDFCERMFVLASDFGMLMTLLHKVNWLTEQRNNKVLQPDDFAVYVVADIHLFHAEMRSIFDSIARAVIIVAGDKTKNLGDKRKRHSFNYLRERCASQPVLMAEAIGEDLSDAISSLGWFPESRGMRDSILHFEKDVELGNTPDDLLPQS